MAKSSLFRGVTLFRPTGKWRAQVSLQGYVQGCPVDQLAYTSSVVTSGSGMHCLLP